MDENYSSKDAYWYRRHTAEAAIESVLKRIPNLETRISELTELNRQITERADTIRFKCVYLVRDGQFVDDNDDGSRGGYSDTWWRSDHFNLPRVEEEDGEEEEVPQPGEPVKVVLKPSNDTQTYIKEFVQCWHPSCQEYNRENYKWPNIPPTTFLLCKDHADVLRLKTLHDYYVDRIPIDKTTATGMEITTMIKDTEATIYERIDTSLNKAIEGAKEILAKETTPSRVITVNWSLYVECTGTWNEMTTLIDLVSCRKIVIAPTNEDERE